MDQHELGKKNGPECLAGHYKINRIHLPRVLDILKVTMSSIFLSPSAPVTLILKELVLSSLLKECVDSH